MKSTRIKVSMSQDGSLSKETANTVDFQFPVIPRKLLKSMGFEKVDDTTYVGIMSVFLNLADKNQEIEVELGVEASDTRKKVMDFFRRSFRKDAGTASAAKEKPKSAAKASKTAKSAKPSKTSKTSKTATKSATKTASAKTTSSAKTASAKSSSAKSATAKTAKTRASKPAAGKKAG